MTINKLIKLTQKEKLKELDALWSKVILARDIKCQKCGKRAVVNACHIFPKGKYPKLRHDARNGIGLCKGCYRFFARKRSGLIKWAAGRYENRYNILKAIDAFKKKEKRDLAFIKLLLENELEKLKKKLKKTKAK